MMQKTYFGPLPHTTQKLIQTLALYLDMDGTGGRYAERNRPVGEDVCHVASRMWNIRTSAEDPRGREGQWNGPSSETETNHKRLSTLRVCWRGRGWADGYQGDGQ